MKPKGAAWTQQDLAKVRCSDPKCTREHIDELWLRSTCHPDAGCMLLYLPDRGVLRQVCVCGRFLSDYQLAAFPEDTITH